MRASFIGFALIGTVAVFGCSRTAPTSYAPEASSRATSTGKPGHPGALAADFAGTTRDGKTVRLSDYRGKTVLLNFFSPG